MSPEAVGIAVRRDAAGLVTELAHDDGPRLAVTSTAGGLVREGR